VTTAPERRGIGPHPGAFSIIEVALALGVVAVAFVGLIGVVPGGLSNFRSAMDLTIGAQIAQRVITDVEQTDFDLLLAAQGTGTGIFYNLPVRYFDDQEKEVFPRQTGAANAAIYRVLVRVSQPGPRDINVPADGFTSLPADTGKTRFQPRDSVFLTVQVARLPGIQPMAVGADWLWPRGVAPMSSYRSVVTRNGRTARASTTTTP